MRTTLLMAVAMGLLGVAAGCGAPTVTARHVLFSDLPIPADTQSIQVGEFSLDSGPSGQWPAFVAETLARQLSRSGHYEVVSSASAGHADVEVTGTLHVDTTSHAGSRKVRRLDPANDKLVTVELPTLVRTASLRTVFSVRDLRSGEVVASAEVQRDYSSLDDPRVRGATGLERPDDPARVPATDQILREQFDHSVTAFVEMLTPAQLVVQIPLSPTLSGSGRKGLDAAAAGHFDEAVRQLRLAVEAEPTDAHLLFDLAAVEEVAGQLAPAAEHYREAWRLSGEKNVEAVRGEHRVRGILDRLQRRRQRDATSAGRSSS